MNSLIHGRVSPVYSGIRGVPGTHVFQRCFILEITGLADVTQVTAEVITNKYNSEVIPTENVDTDFPVAGTRFDISADGLTLTIKGMSHTAVAVLSATSQLQEVGAAYRPVADVVAGKITFKFVAAVAGTFLDLSGIAVGLKIRTRILYLTSD